MRQHLTITVLTLLVSVTLRAADIPTNIANAVAATERSDRDRERDARDRPSELMAFANIAPGMKIADVFGGGGYWTELMARAVGPKGQVRLINNEAYSKKRLEIWLRFASNRLPNAEHQTVDTGDMKLGRNTFDLIVIFMSYHDLYWVDEKQGWPAIDAGGFLDQLQAALKPGGRLLIVDHAAIAGTKSTAAQNLHRIDEAFAKQDIESHGFTLEKTWDGYRNPSDDVSKNVYLPVERGKTDRFTHLYRTKRSGQSASQ
jgi:predicted methyltransferase